MTTTADPHEPIEIPEEDAEAAELAAGDYHPLTDVGNSFRFADQWGNDVLHVAQWGQWLLWDGTRWKPDETLQVYELAKILVEQMRRGAHYLPDDTDEEEARKKAYTAWAKQSGSLARIEAMLKLARSKLAISFKDLDRDPWLFNCENGTVDLRTGELEPARRGDLITKIGKASYFPDATAPTWMRFLEDVQPDPEMRAYLQRLAGYALTGVVTEQTLDFLHGTGANGKTTFNNALLHVAGDYGKQMDPNLLLKTRHDQHPTGLADLHGARLVVTSEVEQGKHLAEVLVKQMTGGDRLKARFMRQDFFEFDSTFKLLLAANHKPLISGVDYAIWRRIHLIPFDVTIPEEKKDKELPDNLKLESNGILAWAVTGCLGWQRTGLAPPETVLAATDAYRAEQDTLREFFEDCCEIGPEYFVLLTELYTAYLVWAEEQGIKYPWSLKRLSSELDERGFPSEKMTSGRYRLKRVKHGLRLRRPGDGPVGDRDQPSQPSRASTRVDNGAGTRTEGSEGAGLESDCVQPSQPAQAATAVYKKAESVPDVPDSPYCTHMRAGARAWRGTGKPGTSGTSGTKRVPFDLETADADQLWSAGPEFIRLIGYRDGEVTRTTTDPALIVEAAAAGGVLVGHNIFAFDLIALARNHGLDLSSVAAIDTKLLAVLDDPPPARMKSGEIDRYYKLDALGERLLGFGKDGDIKSLAREFGGYDQIPVDDQRYIDYVRRDVDVTAALLDRFEPMNEYARREHEVARIAATISLNGFRVDEQLLRTRIAEGERRRAELQGRLVELGLPTTKEDGKEAKSPHCTKQGKEAIRAAFAELGVDLRSTEAGAPALGKEEMERIAEEHPQAADLAETVKNLNGVRTVYETVATHLVGDRVHPQIDFRQATGRWSVRAPGLTVMGKRNGKYVERDVFLPEPGEVMIAVDLAQIDARAVAVHSQDPAYLALFDDPAKDSHAEVAEMVWGDRSRRGEAKALAHAWNYGASPDRISREAGVDFAVAIDFDQRMRRLFPMVVQWQRQIREQAQAGYLIDNGFGRLMKPTPDRSHTQGPALVGQGCARDLLMAGLLRLPWEAVLMLRAVVHDEVVLSVPVDIVDDVEQEVLKALCFEWAPPGAEVPVTVMAEPVNGGRRGRSWGDVYAKEDR